MYASTTAMTPQLRPRGRRVCGIGDYWRIGPTSPSCRVSLPYPKVGVRGTIEAPAGRRAALSTESGATAVTAAAIAKVRLRM
jgi:hypothetical protein